MNKLMALVSTLVIGASSAAMASPATHSAQARVQVGWGENVPAARPFARQAKHSIRDHRGDRYNVTASYTYGNEEPSYFPAYQMPARNVSLATDVSFAGTRGQMELDVRAANGFVDGIHIDALNQTVILSHALVTYTNGQEQMITIGRELAGGQSLNVPFACNGRSVARIDLFQTSSTDLVGQSAGQFNVTTF
jgi:hypothetical protein